MSEIKFRAWDKRHKEILFPDSGYRLKYQRVVGSAETIAHDWGVDARGSLFLSADTIWYPEQDNFVLMQYTGLKDKNGVEIYEGDILQDNRGKEFEVKWNNLYAAFGLKDYSLGKESAPLRGLHPSSQLEVIGNIHENPDLLK